MRPGVRFNGVKVFSATMLAQRANLGEVVTAWIAEHPTFAITEIVVTQSSDESFHCLCGAAHKQCYVQRQVMASRS